MQNLGERLSEGGGRPLSRQGSSFLRWGFPRAVLLHSSDCGSDERVSSREPRREAGADPQKSKVCVKEKMQEGERSLSGSNRASDSQQINYSCLSED